MAIDLSPTTQDALSRIVQNYNQGLDPALHLNDTDFVFDAPIVNPDAAVSLRNTRLRAVPTAVSGKIGRASIYYNRVDLSAINDQPIITRGTATLVSHVVPMLNEFFGINIVAADYVDGPLPAQVGALTPATLNATPVALLFIGALAFQLENGATLAIRPKPAGG